MAAQPAMCSQLLEALHSCCVTVPQVAELTWSVVMMHLMCSRLTTRAFSRHRMAEG